MRRSTRLALAALCAFSLPACDQIKERAGIPDPARIEAEGKAIGSACRHAGRGIEDCFRLNPDASKPAVFAGWKDMNEYMMQNNLEAMEPTISESGQPIAPRPDGKPQGGQEPIDKSQADQPGKPGAPGSATERP